MRIVIHGGMHKTGTTALQRLLHGNRDLLASHGVWYPDVGAQRQGIALNVRDPDWSPALAADLVSGSAKFETVLLSAEVVSAFSADQVERLRRGFDAPVTFVFCFRHWAEFLPSRWVQNCRRRDSQSFDSYVAAVSGNREHSDFWFDIVLPRAAAAPDCTVRAVSYQNAAAPGETPIGAVLRAAGLSPSLIAALVAKAERHNERIDWVAGELARMLIGCAAERLGLPADDACHAVAAFRRRDRSFDFALRFHELDPALLERLRRGIEARAVDRTVQDLPHLDEARARLEGDHAASFINLDADGRAFPAVVRSQMKFANLGWPEFRDAGRVDVETALDALLG